MSMFPRGGDTNDVRAGGPVFRHAGPGTGTILITGSSGRIGTNLSSQLASRGFTVRHFDPVPYAELPAGTTEYVASLDSPGLLEKAVAGADAVIHLAGLPNEDSWSATVSNTINNTELLLRQCAAGGVKKVLLASSHHVAGFYRTTKTLPGDVIPCPDTYYGVAKATVEALGALYHHRFGMDVLALRIGSCFPAPPEPRSVPIWLSPQDLTGIVLHWLALEECKFRVAWGVSNNSRGFLSIQPLIDMGYTPADDSEAFVPQLLRQYGEGAFARAERDYLGGPFCDTPLGRKFGARPRATRSVERFTGVEEDRR